MRLQRTLVALAVASLTACSSLNPFAAKPDPKTLPVPLTEIKAKAPMHQVWATQIGTAGNYVFSPAQALDSIYAAASDGTLARINQVNGQTVWKVNAGMPLTAGVGVDESSVAVVGQKGQLMVFDQDGKLRWKAEASSEVLAAPAVGQGMIVVRSIDNRITAYDAMTGVRKWRVEKNLPALILRSSSGLSISGPVVLAGLPGGRLVELFLQNGGQRWEIAAGEARGATELERISDVSGMPAVMGQDVCVTSFQGRVGCYDLVNGTARWTKNLSSEVGPGIDERFVFAVDEKSNVNAYARTNGSSMWRNDQLLNRKLSTPVSFEQLVVTGDFEGYVHFLAREDGALSARMPTDGSRILVAPIVAGTSLVVQTKAGMVAAFAAQ